ncbi:MAG: hypothetical protein FWF88_05315 [Peptococcaceae bacterium]|nr:hypothetical protein [Peptococcaceae bacterium]MDR2736376.1 hypothetical protein [Gracilibacteraceae bacterium]
MKRPLAFLLIMVLLLGLTACAPTEGKLVYNILVDPGVVLSTEKAEAATYKVERANLLDYYGHFAKRFLASASIPNDQRAKSEYAVRATDGSELLINPISGIHYIVPAYEYISGVFNYRSAGAADPARDDTLFFERDVDLPFMPRARAEDIVKEEVSRVQAGDVRGTVFFLFERYTLNVKETFALDHRSLSAREEDKLAVERQENPREGEESAGKGQWGVEDDCYYVVMEVCLDDIPLLGKSRDLDYLLVYGVTVEICYGAEGIRYLKVSPIYEVHDEALSSGTIISAADALACVKAKYAGIISTKETTVKSLELCYAAFPDDATQKNYHLVPAWCAELQEKMLLDDGKTYYVTSTLYFNAYTGKEFL